MIKAETLDYITNNISELALLIALSEEADELAKAALKLARAKKLINHPTPISIDDATANLLEEYEDVAACFTILQRKKMVAIPNNDGLEHKLNRWAERLRYNNGR